jgi:hypothetical protein
MTTDRNVLIAERVMGWRWFTVATVNVLVPPFMARDMVLHPALYQEGKHGSQTNGEDGNFFYDSARIPPEHYPPIPDPEHDPVACHEALDKMREMGWEKEWREDDHGHTVELAKWYTVAGTQRWRTIEGMSAIPGPLGFCDAACAAMERAVEG